jgi:hypothetical protein
MAGSTTLCAPPAAGEPSPRRPSRCQRTRAFLVPLLGEVLLLGALFWVYRFARHLADGHPATALSHAQSVWRLERLLRLPNEADLQAWALSWTGWVRLANTYYVSVHFPLTAAFLLWVWWRHRGVWPRVRAVIVSATAVALVVQVLYPLAPPRFLPGGHLVDTMAVYGPSAYSTAPGQGIANQYAAMPSLHVGWALLVAWGVITYGRSRLRWLVLAHPACTVVVVVLTANHYWLDGAVGAALLAGAVSVTAEWAQRPVAAPHGVTDVGGTRGRSLSGGR